MRESHDTDFTEVNGHRFDRMRVAAAHALIEALRPLDLLSRPELLEQVRALVRSLELTPPELACARCSNLRKTHDLLADARGITWGAVLQSFALKEKVEARIDALLRGDNPPTQ